MENRKDNKLQIDNYYKNKLIFPNFLQKLALGGNMKGIVRRIDELGRVVIPKEIRRTMHIKQGEQIEMQQLSENEIMLKKYSELSNVASVVADYAEVLSDKLDKKLIIYDATKVLVSKKFEEDLKGYHISNALYNQLEKRESFVSGKPLNLLKSQAYIADKPNNFPLIVAGDLYGGILVDGDLNKENVTVINTIVACLEANLATI